MCPPTPEEPTPDPEVKVERVVDVIKSDAQLASCKTVAELCIRKPDVGSVLLGGNHLSREHGALTGGMTCTVSSLYVAKCCFIARRSEGIILLPRNASIAELKRRFNDLASLQVKSTLEISVLSLHSASTEQEFIDEIVCKDSDGNILEDTATMPAASATACADVGCHATFFFDVKPLSMRETYVKDRIKASSLAVNTFVQGLCGSGSRVDYNVVTVAAAPAAVAQCLKPPEHPVQGCVQTKHLSKKEKKRAAAAVRGRMAPDREASIERVRAACSDQQEIDESAPARKAAAPGPFQSPPVRSSCLSIFFRTNVQQPMQLCRFSLY